jgi:hypothetical protein
MRSPTVVVCYSQDAPEDFYLFGRREALHRCWHRVPLAYIATILRGNARGRRHPLVKRFMLLICDEAEWTQPPKPFGQLHRLAMISCIA